MKLHFRKTGEGKPLVVLHGVFGSSDNLHTVCKQIGEAGYEVYMVDARNHGQSERGEDFNYQVLAQDLDEFLSEQGLDKPFLLGHSMGGKTVLYYSQHYVNYSGLILVDIAARGYKRHHDHIIQGLQAIDPKAITSRKEAEEIFSQYVTDPGERQFLLKNLYRTDDGAFDWRINVPVLAANAGEVVANIELAKEVDVPLLLMRGGASNYVRDSDFDEVKAYYPKAELLTVPGANHWVHATNSTGFVSGVLNFLKRI
ncbi:alpha/beta hydrolase fold protein [Leadbetterella byssophila DSM 17132]|uniref:Alpha/beta hydrolase fold protein n=1 Tax=Leadbetterella byssophila (strain DSM 17132 / JCM 16389 / KACC 11308 / NBRC 106382 / 4M15) TaxID=649349 RepID=E4RRD1_LEAB4|nr:alpha/beta fold hydrolase [Leadbetterella byssophila]ADQ18464.1 alpha/beta hydrolase fold protein [Leadbetterella byssophila DSM 17132]